MWCVWFCVRSAECNAAPSRLQVATDGRWTLPLAPFHVPPAGSWAKSIESSIAFASVAGSNLRQYVCVELLPWMLQPLPPTSLASHQPAAQAQVSLDREEGRLHCPKCGGKLGRWAWGSSMTDRCSGAVWSALCVVFALQTSRLR